MITLDTKYKEFDGKHEPGHVNQLISYSNSTGVKYFGLIYIERRMNYMFYNLYQNIKLDIVSFDIIASDQAEFETKTLVL